MVPDSTEKRLKRNSFFNLLLSDGRSVVSRSSFFNICNEITKIVQAVGEIAVIGRATRQKCGHIMVKSSNFTVLCQT